SITLPFDTKRVESFTEIEPTGADVDYFRFSASAGDVILARVVGGRFDTLLGLFRITGSGTGTLVAFDDDSGPGVLSLLAYVVPQSGNFALAASAFPDFTFTGAGFSGGRYVLDLQVIK